MLKTEKYARSVRGPGVVKEIIVALLDQEAYFEVIPVARAVYDVRVRLEHRGLLDALVPGKMSVLIRGGD